MINKRELPRLDFEVLREILRPPQGSLTELIEKEGSDMAAALIVNPFQLHLETSFQKYWQAYKETQDQRYAIFAGKILKEYPNGINSISSQEYYQALNIEEKYRHIMGP